MQATRVGQVLSFQDRKGQTTNDFRRAKTVMVYSGNISRPIDAKTFKKPIKINETVEFAD